MKDTKAVSIVQACSELKTPSLTNVSKTKKLNSFLSCFDMEDFLNRRYMEILPNACFKMRTQKMTVIAQKGSKIEPGLSFYEHPEELEKIIINIKSSKKLFHSLFDKKILMNPVNVCSLTKGVLNLGLNNIR